MPFTVTMPKLSPTMEEGAVAKWHKKEGDKVEAGELLVDVATDKATIEYNALDAGYLRKILVKEGKMVKINEPIAVFTETQNESIEDYAPQGIASSAPASSAPAPAPTAPEAQPSQVAPTSGATMQQPAFTPEPPLTSYRFPFPNSSTRTAASPLAKKLAKQKGLDVTSVKGSGPCGRVMSRDLDLAQPDAVVSFGRKNAPTLAPGTYEEMELSPMRKVIAQRLQQAKSFIPHIYIQQTVAVDALWEAREQLKSSNLKISFNDFVIRASALALKEHPKINSGFNSVNQSIILFQTIDIAVAVSVNDGLITPIVRHADYKDVGEISTEVKELATRAKAGKLSPEEYKGGSFTISNMGMFGITSFAAIINPPQSSILAVGSIEERPVVKQGKVKVGKVIELVLSSDHRVVDGAEAAQFLKSVQKYLENPTLLVV